MAAGDSGRRIARLLGRHCSVVNREVGRNGGRAASRASDAHQSATASVRRPKERKLERDSLLLAKVNEGLRQKWSPQQIATRLRADFPDDEAMRVSHEAIYQALFVQAKGQLKKQLIGRLPTGRVRRVSHAECRAVIAKPQVIPDIVMITERPAEVADRGRPRPLGG